MKNITFKLLWLLAIFCSIKGYAEAPKYQFDLQTGCRKDSFKWSIGGADGKPNIISELDWYHLQGAEIASGFKIFQNNAYVRLSANYAKLFSGSVQDSDYFGDNRKAEFSRSKANASGSTFYDISIATGFQFSLFPNKQWLLFPLLGYSWDAQNLKIKHGFQIIPSTRSIPNLNSFYKSWFQGPFVGADLNYHATSLLTILATFEYHFLKYNGTGHWNRRRDFFKDFRQTASGHGIFASMGASYQINNQLFLGITFNGRYFKTKRGNSRFYAIIEDEKYIIDRPFNGVKWKSFSALVSLQQSF